MAARMLITPVLPAVAEPAAAAWACAPAVANRAAPASRAARISWPRNRNAVVILEFTLFLLVLEKYSKIGTCTTAFKIWLPKIRSQIPAQDLCLRARTCQVARRFSKLLKKTLAQPPR